MKIANPIYDLAFKYMMENNRIAKLVLSTILEQEVVSVKLGTQELVMPRLKHDGEGEKEYEKTNENPFTVFRLDFKADIITKEGRRETVLIEIQKSSSGTELKRFRTYLGKNYQKGVEETDKNGKKTIVFYPIVTIYILGYHLPELPYLGLAIERRLIDLSTGKEIEAESQFVDKLNHKSFILQVQNLPPHRKTKLEKFMTLFNQAWISESNYILDLEEVPDEFAEVAQYLKAALADEDLRANLEAEEEMKDYSIRLKVAEAKEKEAIAKEKAAVAKEKAANARTKKALLEKDEAIYTLSKAIKNLKAQGMNIAQIAQLMGKEIEEIAKIIGQE